MSYGILAFILWSLGLLGYKSSSRIIEALAKIVVNSTTAGFLSFFILTAISVAMGHTEILPLFEGFLGAVVITIITAIGTLVYCVRKEIV